MSDRVGQNCGASARDFSLSRVQAEMSLPLCRRDEVQRHAAGRDDAADHAEAATEFEHARDALPGARRDKLDDREVGFHLRDARGEGCGVDIAARDGQVSAVIASTLGSRTRARQIAPGRRRGCRASSSPRLSKAKGEMQSGRPRDCDSRRGAMERVQIFGFCLQGLASGGSLFCRHVARALDATKFINPLRCQPYLRSPILIGAGTL